MKQEKYSAWQSFPVTLELPGDNAEAFKQRLIEEQQRHPSSTLDSLVSWGVRYYLQHAYRKPDPLEEKIRLQVIDAQMDLDDDPGMFEEEYRPLTVEDLTWKAPGEVRSSEALLVALRWCMEQKASIQFRSDRVLVQVGGHEIDAEDLIDAVKSLDEAGRGK